MNKRENGLKAQKNEYNKMHKDQAAEYAEISIPEIEALINQLTEHKTEEDAKLEAILDENKGKTDTLRQQLEEKTQELAPINQEKAVFQAALDTAITEVKLLTDAQSQAKDQFEAAEKELDSLDEHRVEDATKEENELSLKESSLSKRIKELMVRNIVCLPDLTNEVSHHFKGYGGRSKDCESSKRREITWISFLLLLFLFVSTRAALLWLAHLFWV